MDPEGVDEQLIIEHGVRVRDGDHMERAYLGVNCSFKIDKEGDIFV